jgi:3'-phosphoadenosine 5'-phosphosulfate sulfotransferase (PAPS reductase)/FAD synthetase
MDARRNPMNLTSFDIILVNTSGGKDSQTMLRKLVEMARDQGVEDRLVAVHCDLGRAEWPGTWDLAKEQADGYGVRIIKVNRPQGDLLDQIEARGMFPSSSARYCTSDQKRGQVGRVITQLVKELGLDRQAHVLNCMGLRRQESPARAKKNEYELDKRNTNGRRMVWNWLPIIDMTEDEVWDDIRESGVRHHPAYDLGMPRLSCAFCVLASRPALVLAAQALPELAAEYEALEGRIGHTIQNGTSMTDIIAEARCTEGRPAVACWAA